MDRRPFGQNIAHSAKTIAHSAGNIAHSAGIVAHSAEKINEHRPFGGHRPFGEKCRPARTKYKVSHRPFGEVIKILQISCVFAERCQLLPPVTARCLHINAQGLHIPAEGMPMAAQSVHIGTQGLQMQDERRLIVILVKYCTHEVQSQNPSDVQEMWMAYKQILLLHPRNTQELFSYS